MMIETIEANYPRRVSDVREPFVIVRHRDYWGNTWYYPTNRNGRVCTSGHPTPDGPAEQIRIMRLMVAR